MMRVLLSGPNLPLMSIAVWF